MIDLIEIGKHAAAVVAICGVTTLAWKVGRGLIRTMRKLGRLADEVLGDGDQRQGWGRRLAAIEGLGRTNASRLTAIESRVSGMEARIGEVVDEVRPNGGSSMRDQINRIEEATGATREDPPEPVN